MADRNLAIRLAVIDGGKVKAELRDVGETGSRSLQRIEDAARPASKALQVIDGYQSFVASAAVAGARATAVRRRPMAPTT